MENKQRTMTDDALGSTIHLLQEAGVPNAMIAEALFSHLKTRAIPSKGGNSADNMVWYAQLQRFRFDLDTHIHIIETALDEAHD